MDGHPGTDRTSRWLDLLAPALVLLAPFVSFVKYHGYSLFRPEILLGLLLLGTLGVVSGLAIHIRERTIRPLVIAGLVVLFVDVQYDLFKPLFQSVPARAGLALGIFAATLVCGRLLGANLTKVVAAVFGTVLVSTLVLPVESGLGAEAGRPEKPVPSRELPVVVHLILDEHIGIGGLPDEIPEARALEERLTSFYERNGFYLYPGAYSQYVDTYLSIGHVLNLAPTFDPTVARLSRSWGFEFELRRNDYLAEMHRRGYRIRVYQPDYLNLCPEGLESLAFCHTYVASRLEPIQTMPLLLVDKARIVAGMYLERFTSYKAIRLAYARLKERVLDQDLRLPDWSWERIWIHPIGSVQAVERLKRDLADASPGELFLAHLLLPHHLFLYDSSCNVRPDVTEWVSVGDEDKRHQVRNTPDARVDRYRLYLEQVECTTAKIGEILDVLRANGTLDEAVVIVHGDHGSRISFINPFASNRERLVDSDFRDAFSTLFAIRAPGIPPGQDPEVWPITELFTELVKRGFRSLPAHQTRAGHPFVYLRVDGTETFVPEPLRGFPAGAGHR